MRLINADKLCEDLLSRWHTADAEKEELIRAVMADVVTPIVVAQPTVEFSKDCVSRQAVIKTVEKYKVNFLPEYMEQHMEKLIDAIKDDLIEYLNCLPSVSPELKSIT